ncbi:MAG: Signal recognition particle protein [bacterium ADurb.Bin157]|jgi:signal recognition particle subunit SRP54|nr:signal recognition particle protein [Candidatus Riflebacteria bacterium]MDD3376022.1 signal recognition particle protein [Candidatus Riflebacteria bacterium]OQB49085.1 MAG: Signal recognition particle protein [bacterium ADurb.Bin157]
MFQGLSEKLMSVFDNLRRSGKLTEKDIDLALNEVKMALLEADVNFKVVKTFIKRIKERALGAEILKSLTPSQQVIKIVMEELTVLLGTERSKINISSKKPTVILMAGLQGSGKTTTSAKLALHLRKEDKKTPMLVACDIYRPAAVKQLQILGDQLSVEVFTGKEGQKPASIAKDSIEHALNKDCDVVIIDTAGRLHIDDDMMNEVKEISTAVKPTEVLLVVDAMTGQDAVNMATSFNSILELTGIILTKLDGDARGGAALSIREVTGKPVKFVGIGEKTSSLEAFYPERMAQRILGMGDVMTLIEKAQANMDEQKMKEIEKRVLEAEFNFNDFLYQLTQIKKMGPLDQLLGMIPGLSSMGNLNEFSFDDKKFKRFEAIILSMTEAERNQPDLIDGSRRKRIAAGSGNDIQDVNQLLKQFSQMRKMMKQFGNLAKRKGSGRFGKLFGK